MCADANRRGGSRRATAPVSARPWPRSLTWGTFYESDCQGQISSLLIAFRSSPLQSAPTDRNAAIVRTRGWAEQSYAADSSSVSPLIHNETISSAPAITFERCRPWFYLRLTPIVDARGPVASSGHPRGPVVRRVPRRDCCRAERPC